MSTALPRASSTARCWASGVSETTRSNDSSSRSSKVLGLKPVRSPPSSSMTAAAKGSTSVSPGSRLRPTLSTKTDRPCASFISASAIGERTLLKLQANNTAPGSASTRASAPPVQGADEGEQPTRGVQVGLHLAVQSRLKQRRAFVVQAAPAHIEGLDLPGRRVADGLVVALADHEVVADHAPERGQRQQVDLVETALRPGDVQGQPVLGQGNLQIIGPVRRALGLEVVVLDQVEDGDLPLLLLVARDRREGILVDLDALQAVGVTVVGHG